MRALRTVPNERLYLTMSVAQRFGQNAQQNVGARGTKKSVGIILWHTGAVRQRNAASAGAGRQRCFARRRSMLCLCLRHFHRHCCHPQLTVLVFRRSRHGAADTSSYSSYQPSMDGHASSCVQGAWIGTFGAGRRQLLPAERRRSGPASTASGNCGGQASTECGKSAVSGFNVCCCWMMLLCMLLFAGVVIEV